LVGIDELSGEVAPTEPGFDSGRFFYKQETPMGAGLAEGNQQSERPIVYSVSVLYS